MEIIGHRDTKHQIEIAMAAAAKRNFAMPHILFAGAPGCGKTTLAKVMAKRASLPFIAVMPDDLKDYSSTIALLEKLNHENYDSHGNRTGVLSPSIIFFDEIHRMPLKGQELLGVAMENFVIESPKTGKYLWTPYFTIVGATTMEGKLSKPFRDRFKLNFTFQPYEIDEMIEIVRLHSSRLKINISADGVKNIAQRSRGTPRIAVRFLEMVRDRVVATRAQWADLELINETFKRIGIDEYGFNPTDRKILSALYDTGAAIGLDNLAIITELDVKTIRSSIEPFLIKQGVMAVSGRGRILTKKGSDFVQNSGTTKFVKKEIDPGYRRK
jgi:Holliday junction DNA helicase RuvB